MFISAIWISWLCKYFMMNKYWCYLIDDQIAFMKYWKLGQDVISNIKSNSNWPWQKLTLLIQVMKKPRIVLASVKTKSHDSDNVIKVIVIYFSIPWLCRLHSQVMRRAFSYSANTSSSRNSSIGPKEEFLAMAWKRVKHLFYFTTDYSNICSCLTGPAWLRLGEVRKWNTQSPLRTSKIHSVVRFGIIIHIHNESRERIVSSRRRLSYWFTKISVTSCDQRLRTKGILVYRCCCC